jgi:hypothetical protein
MGIVCCSVVGLLCLWRWVGDGDVELTKKGGQRRGRHWAERSQAFEISTFWDCVIGHSLCEMTSLKKLVQSYPANASLTW